MHVAELLVEALEAHQLVGDPLAQGAHGRVPDVPGVCRQFGN